MYPWFLLSYSQTNSRKYTTEYSRLMASHSTSASLASFAQTSNSIPGSPKYQSTASNNNQHTTNSNKKVKERKIKTLPNRRSVLALSDSEHNYACMSGVKIEVSINCFHRLVLGWCLGCRNQYMWYHWVIVVIHCSQRLTIGTNFSDLENESFCQLGFPQCFSMNARILLPCIWYVWTVTHLWSNGYKDIHTWNSQIKSLSDGSMIHACL